MNNREVIVVFFAVVALIATIITAVSLFQKSNYQDYQKDGFVDNVGWVIGVSIATVVLILVVGMNFSRIFPSNK